MIWILPVPFYMHLLMFLTFSWAEAWQNKQNDLCTKRRLRSAWAFAQSDQSSLCLQLVAKDARFLHADSGQCSDWADADLSLRFQVILLALSCGGSYDMLALRTKFYDYRNDPKFSDRYAWANSADQDQTTPQGLHCLPFRLHLLDSLLYGRATQVKF